MKLFKKTLSVVLVLTMLLSMSVVQVSAADFSLKVGETATFTCRQPHRHTVSSSNTAVATVSGTSSGWNYTITITAKAVGEATITCAGSTQLSETTTKRVVVTAATPAQPTYEVTASNGTSNYDGTTTNDYLFETVELDYNGTAALSASAKQTATDNTETDYSVVWSTDNPAVTLSADSGGSITASATTVKADTTANVTATLTATDLDDIVITFPITVKAPTLNVTASVDGEGVSLTSSGNAYTVTDATVLQYESATVFGTAELVADAMFGSVDYNADWAVTAGNAVTVDANGKVSAAAIGDATVTATLTKNGYDTITVAFPIAVTEPALVVSATINDADATLDDTYKADSISLYYVSDTDRESVTLTATAVKGSTTYVLTGWSSAMPAIATVGENGVVTATGGGSTTVTATLVNPNDASDVVEVTFPITVSAPDLIVEVSYPEVEVGETTATKTTETLESPYLVDYETIVAVGSTVQFTAVAKKGNTKYPLTWSSSDATVATVDPNGLVTGVSSAACEIYATFTDEYGTVHTITFPVSSRATGVRAYFYLWASDVEGAAYGVGGVWTPFGRGDLNSNYITTAEADTKTPYQGEFTLPSVVTIDDMILWVSPDFAPYPSDGDLYEESTENPATVTTDFPTITLNGVTYYYELDPNRKTGIGYSIYEYDIDWMRIKKEGGANATGYDTWVGYGSNENKNLTWHVDGLANLVAPVTFQYNVIEPGANGFTERTNLSFKASEDTLISTLYSTNKKFAALPDTTSGNTEYVFEGWYYDEACTIPVTSERITALAKDQVLDKSTTANDKIINVYGKYVAAPKTVTFVFESEGGATITKNYFCNADDRVPMPYGPNGEGAGKYFAGWSYRDADGNAHTVYGNDEKAMVKWVADEAGGDVMTISAVYYTDTEGTYNLPEKTTSENYTIVQTNTGEVNRGKIDLLLFGTPVMKTVNGKNLLIVQFNPGFTSVPPVADDGSDTDTGTVIAKNNQFKVVGFVVSTDDNVTESEEENLVAQAPTVQGGYANTESNDVFTRTVNGVTFASLDLDANGYYIVIKLDSNVDWATPYAIDTAGAYHYGTPWAH